MEKIWEDLRELYHLSASNHTDTVTDTVHPMSDKQQSHKQRKHHLVYTKVVFCLFLM